MGYPDNGKLGRYRKGVTQYRQSKTPTIIAKFDGECVRCGNIIRKGEWVRYDYEAKTVRHASTCKQKSSKRTF